MTIDDVDGVRERLARCANEHGLLSRADLRALLDDHARLAACDEGEHHEITRLRAEVERLTRERDEARVWGEDHTCRAVVRAERAERDRDRLAAALAEVRDEALLCGAPRVTRVAAMAVADLATARDARVRAEALRDDRLAMELGEALMARMSELRFRPTSVEQWAGVAADALGAVCRAEADRTERGGR